MQHEITIAREKLTPENQRLADRVDAGIGKAEVDLDAVKSELTRAMQVEAQAKAKYDELHGLTSSIRNLAPLIREELNSRERSWRAATAAKLKVAEACELANKEFASACRARAQLQQIGLYRAAMQQTGPSARAD
jgi:hypothetical protein